MNRTEINAMSAAWITQATNDLVNKLNMVLVLLKTLF